jgi:hypothetical protein
VSAPVTVVYVAGAGHSGTTLLDVLLATHSRVTSVGEVRTLDRRPGVRCTCGARSFARCPFWSKVDERLRALLGRPLPEIELLGLDRARFARDNEALFRAVAEVSGCRVVVDSSKSPRRLDALLATPGLDVLPVHVRRHPAAVAWSHRRKGRSGLRAAWHHRRRGAALRRCLAGRSRVAVDYDELATRPEGVLAAVLAPLGLAVEPGQLDWAGRERHNLGGNRMRRGKRSRIHPDREWQEALSPLERRLFTWVGGTTPGRPRP